VTGGDLARMSLLLRAELHRRHAANALRRLAAAAPGARTRRGGRCDSTASREWRRARRALRHAADFEAQARRVGGAS